MADNGRSYRSNDPYRRAAEPPRPGEPAGGDPLAELARLIGQSDPFAEFGRSNQRPAAPPSFAQPAQAPHYPPPDAYQPQDPYPQQDPYPPQEPYPQQDYYATQDRYAVPDPYAQHDRYSQDGVYGQHDRYAAPAHDDWRAQQQDLRQHYRPDEFAARDEHRPEASLGPNFGANYGTARDFPPAHDQHGDGRYAAYDDPRAAAAAPHYADDHDADAHARDGGRQQDQQYYQDDAPLEPHEDEMYDDAPRARHRGGLATALALIGCAMLGTAGAYAYRSYTSAPGSTQPPPVISADNQTNKIMPASVGNPRVTTQDQLANAGKEQVISKQEEPVALREVGTQSAPRVVLPAPVAPAQGGSPSGAAGNEPKKIRTVTIRPDGTDVSGRPVGALGAPSAPPARTVTPPAPKAAAPAAPNAAGPISLEPQAGEPAPAPRTRTANANASAGHVVQLSSQKTEAEAQASFRSLQAKFPNELGNREPIIRKADLGNKGVFYRTMVGPFGSAQEAAQFCTSYKAAGGQCVVPTN
jgi:hypothetical protein